jgi:hypothetical protein
MGMSMKGVGLPAFWKRYLGIRASFAGIMAAVLSNSDETH